MIAPEVAASAGRGEESTEREPADRSPSSGGSSSSRPARCARWTTLPSTDGRNARSGRPAGPVLEQGANLSNIGSEVSWLAFYRSCPSDCDRCAALAHEIGCDLRRPTDGCRECERHVEARDRTADLRMAQKVYRQAFETGTTAVGTVELVGLDELGDDVDSIAVDSFEMGSR